MIASDSSHRISGLIVSISGLAIDYVTTMNSRSLRGDATTKGDDAMNRVDVGRKIVSREEWLEARKAHLVR